MKTNSELIALTRTGRHGRRWLEKELADALEATDRRLQPLAEFYMLRQEEIEAALISEEMDRRKAAKPRLQHE